MMDDKRQAQGLPPLKAHGSLSGLAREQAQYLVKRREAFAKSSRIVGEYASDYRAYVAWRNDKLDSFHEVYGSVSSVSEVPALWDQWQSAEFYKWPLSQKFVYSGVGCAEGPNGEVFCVVMFANPQNVEVTVKDLISQ